MKKSSIFLAVALLFLFNATVNAAPYKMRLSHQLPESHFLATEIKNFKKLVEEKTEGGVIVEIYPSAQAFKPKEVIGAVVTNSIESGMSTNMEWSGMIPALDIFNIPYLLTDPTVIEKAINGEVGTSLSKLMEAKGVVPLMWLLQCRTNIYTTNEKVLKMPTDFKGKKMRGTGRVMNTGNEALGAATVSISGPEVYQSLQLGTLDVGMTGPEAALARHYYEVQKYGTIADSLSVFHVVFANKAFISSLPAEYQKAIQEASATVQVEAFSKSEEERQRAIGELSEKMTIHIQTKEEADAWKAVMVKPVMNYFIEKTGQEGRDLLNYVEKL